MERSSFKSGDVVPDSLLPASFVSGDIVPASLLPTTSRPPMPYFSVPEPEKEQAGFISELVRSATTLGLADEAAAFAAKPTEENRRDLLAAAESKYESAGGFGMDKGLAKNFQAFRELAGGSIGFLAAPIVAGVAAGPAGVVAAPAALGTQYTIENLVRQAEEQERAVAEEKTPEDVSVGKALVGATGQTALDVAGMRLLRPLFSRLPGLQKLVGEADDVAVRETGAALKEAIDTGKYQITKEGIFRGVGKGITVEIPQEVAQQAIERWQAGLSLTDEEAQEEYKQAAIGAALLGGPIGGAGAALQQRAVRTEAERKLAGEQEAEAKLEAEDQAALDAETEKMLAEDEAAKADAAETAEIEKMLAEDEAAKADAAETAEIEKMLAEDEAVRQQRAAELETLKAESELETKDLKVQASRQLQTENKRRQILLPIIESADASYAPAIANAFSTALKRAGFRDTDITPSEQNLIDRAVGVLTATKPPLEQIPTTSEATQNELLEAAATRVRQKQEPGQLSFPGLGRRRGAKPDVTPAEETVEPNIITEEFLEELKIPKTASLRRGNASIIGKDLNTPEVQEALRSYASNEIVLAKNKESSVRVQRALDINRMLQKRKGIPETQMDLFDRIAPTKKETTTPEVAPVEEAAAPEVAPVEEAAAPEVAPVEEAVTPTAPVEEVSEEQIKQNAPEGATHYFAGHGLYYKYLKRPRGYWLMFHTPESGWRRSNPDIQDYIEKGLTRIDGKKDQKYPAAPPGVGKEKAKESYQAKQWRKYDKEELQPVKRTTYTKDKRGRRRAKTESFLSGIETPPPPRFYSLVSDSVDNTAVPLSDSVVATLETGRLKDAIQALGVDQNLSKSLRTVAKALARVVGNTKIEIVDGLPDANGNSLAGLFDPKTNTIKLNSQTGLNTHTLLHEQTHAAVSAVMDNPSHPVTKKLTKLFNQVRPYLGTAYGAENLQDFVSEAFTNPSFQQKLSSIINKGESLSAFERFINAITNFVRGMFGLPHKQQGIRNMDDLNATIMSIMAPAPEYRNAGELFMAGPAITATQINNSVSSATSMNSVKAETDLKTLVESADNVISAIGAQLTSLPVLIKFAKKYIPEITKDEVVYNADTLYNIINSQEGYRKKVRGVGDKLILDIQTWAAGDKQALQTFSDLINYSTREEVDASLSRREAEAKYKNDPTQLDEWTRWSQVYNSPRMDNKGKALYKEVFDAYKFLRNEFLDVFKLQLKSAKATDEQITEAVNSLEAKLLELGVIEPFASLSRNEGKYWAYYTAKDPVTGKMEFMARNFSSIFARNRHLKELEEANVQVSGEVSLIENFDADRFRDAPPGSFVNSVVETLRKNNVPTDVEESILRMFANLLPENAYFRGMTQKRKGTIGFLDAITALDNSFKRASTLLASSKYESELREFRKYISELQKKSQNENDPNAKKISQYVNALDLHADFALNPNVQNWAKVATSVGFNYGLGFNISGYLIQSLALPSVITPYIAGEHVGNYRSIIDAYNDTAKAIARSLSVFRNSKSFVTGLNRMGMEGYDFNDPNLPPALQLFKVLQDEMRDKGQFKLTSVDKELDVENISLGPLDRTFGKDWFAKLNRVSGWFMSHSEQVLRETTTISEYQMNLAQQLGIKVNELDAAFRDGRITPDMMKAAADAAIYAADLLNSGVMAQMAPPIAKNGFGKVIFLFRKYSANLFTLLLNLADTSLRGSEADKKVARAQFAGIFAGTTVTAGIGGAPLFGTLALIYNLSKDDDEDDLETVLRKTIDGRLYGGLGNYVLGAEISSRAGLADFIFREPFATSNQPYVYQALEVLGGPLVGMGLSVNQGLTRIGEGNISRGTELLLPTGLRNPLKALRFYTEGAQTMDGDQIMPPVNEKEAVFQVLGLAPANYIQLLEKNSATYRASRAVTEKRSDLYRRYFRAYQDHDTEEQQDILEEIAEYNNKYPEYPIMAKDILRSIKTRLRGQALSLDGVTVSPRLRQRYIESREEWDSVNTLWGDMFGG